MANLKKLGETDEEVKCTKRGAKKRRQAITQCHQILEDAKANDLVRMHAPARNTYARAYALMHAHALEWLANHTKDDVESDEGTVVWWDGATVNALAEAVRGARACLARVQAHAGT